MPASVAIENEAASEAFLSQLELDLKEKLNLKNSLNYLIDDSDPEKYLVSLSSDQFQNYIPNFSGLNDSLHIAKQTAVQKTIVFAEMMEQMKRTKEDFGEKLETNSCNQNIDGSESFSNWFGKQRARFRIRKTEKLKTKNQFITSTIPVTDDVILPSESNAAMEEKSAENSPSVLSELSNEPADVRIFRISERLDLPAPLFFYEEIKHDSGNAEVKCKLEFLGQTFALTRIGAKKIEVKELVAEQALEALRDKIATMEYQKVQLEALESGGDAKSSKPTKKFIPASVGELVPIDIDKINSPYWDLNNEIHSEDKECPDNLFLLLHQFARRKRLKPPMYTIISKGIYFTGSATFVGHSFDLNDRTFTSKKETKFQLAFIIWKSLKNVGKDINLNIVYQKAIPKPIETTTSNPQFKYTLKENTSTSNLKLKPKFSKSSEATYNSQDPAPSFSQNHIPNLTPNNHMSNLSSIPPHYSHLILHNGMASPGNNPVYSHYQPNFPMLNALPMVPQPFSNFIPMPNHLHPHFPNAPPMMHPSFFPPHFPSNVQHPIHRHPHFFHQNANFHIKRPYPMLGNGYVEKKQKPHYNPTVNHIKPHFSNHH